MATFRISKFHVLFLLVLACFLGLHSDITFLGLKHHLAFCIPSPNGKREACLLFCFLHFSSSLEQHRSFPISMHHTPLHNLHTHILAYHI